MAELDLVFLCDTTGSMGSYLRAAKENIETIINTIVQSEKCDVRFALVEYRDHPPQDSTFAFRLHDFTSSIKTMKTAVNGMSADGGGDGPESVVCGLKCAADLEYREKATKIIVWIADAPPHGLNRSGDGFPNGCPCGHDWMQVIRQCMKKGIVIYSVGAEPLSFRHLRSLMRAAAQLTGGQFAALGSANVLGQLIIAGAIEEIQLNAVFQRIEEELQSDPAYIAAPPSEKKQMISARVAKENVQVDSVEIDSIFDGDLPPIPSIFLEAETLTQLRETIATMPDVNVRLKNQPSSAPRPTHFGCPPSARWHPPPAAKAFPGCDLPAPTPSSDRPEAPFLAPAPPAPPPPFPGCCLASPSFCPPPPPGCGCPPPPPAGAAPSMAAPSCPQAVKRVNKTLSASQHARLEQRFKNSLL